MISVFIPSDLDLQAVVRVHVSSAFRGGPRPVAGRDGREGADVRSSAETLRRQPDLPRRSRIQLHRKVLPSSGEQRYETVSSRLSSSFAVTFLNHKNHTLLLI
jgi:hypothetical protein